MRRLCAYLVLLVAVVLSLSMAAVGPGRADSAASQDLLDTIKTRGEMHFGAYAFPPFYIPKGGSAQGVFADVDRLVAKTLGVKAKFTFLTGAAFVPAITSGRVDTITGLSNTPERAKVIGFPSHPTLWNPTCIVHRTSDTSVTGRLSTLNGKVVGVTRGSPFESLVNNAIKKGVFTPKAIRVYDTYEAPLQEVRNGRIDVAFFDVPSAQYALKVNPKLGYKCEVLTPQVIGQSASYWAAKKSEKRLLGYLSSLDKKWQKDGTFKRILAKYGLTNKTLWTGR